MPTEIRSLLASAALFAVAPWLTGCELLEQLEDRSATIQVFATHHGTPEDGVFPNRGGDGEHRSFETDEGWEVTLGDAFVVTAGVELHRCEGASVALDLFQGPLPEDFRATDLDVLSVGSVDVDPTRFCAVTVRYAPFVAEPWDDSETAAKVDGDTMFLAGWAERGDDMVGLEVRSHDLLEVNLDFSDAVGGPVEVTGDESFPLELTLAKTYDRFFDGIDFTDFEPGDLEQSALAALEFETSVQIGTLVGIRD